MSRISKLKIRIIEKYGTIYNFILQYQLKHDFYRKLQFNKFKASEMKFLGKVLDIPHEEFYLYFVDGE